MSAAQLQALVLAAALRITPGAIIEIHAFVFLLEHDVDDTGNGGRAVNGGIATRNDIDVIDHRHRNIRQIREGIAAVVGQRIVGHLLAVDQEQRVIHRQAEQTDGLGALGESAGRLIALHAAIGDRRGFQRVVRSGKALLAQVLGGNLDYRRGSLDLGLRNQRAGHHHSLKGFLFILLLRLRGIRLVLRLGSSVLCPGAAGHEKTSADRGGQKFAVHS